MNLLDLVLFAPAVGCILVQLLPKDNADTIKRATFVISILVFLGSLLLIPGVLGNPGADDLCNRYPMDGLPEHPVSRRDRRR